VGKVLADGLGRGFGVGSLVGNGVDRRTTHALQPDRIRMDGDQQVGLVLARDANALVEAQEYVPVTRQEDVVFAQIAKRLLQFERESERYGLFERTGDALRTCVDAAMA